MLSNNYCILQSGDLPNLELHRDNYIIIKNTYK